MEKLRGPAVLSRSFANLSRSALSRSRRCVMLPMTWPWNERPSLSSFVTRFSGGFSDDMERAMTATAETAHGWRRGAVLRPWRAEERKAGSRAIVLVLVEPGYVFDRLGVWQFLSVTSLPASKAGRGCRVGEPMSWRKVLSSRASGRG